MQGFLFIVFRTNKWVISGQDEFEASIKSKQPIMLCSWHERFLYAVYYFKLKKMKNVWAISSNHNDSQIMAYFLKRASINLIKGSSTRGWENVIKKMFKTFKNPESIIAITNDGPKGPPMVAKKGSVALALKNNSQIIAITGEASCYWRLPSWDGTIIPKPFSTIYIQFSENLNDTNIEGQEVKVVSDYITKNYNDLKNKL